MTECVYCGQAEGHSPRCSVTKFGVAEMRWDGERRNALAENDRLRIAALMAENSALRARWDANVDWTDKLLGDLYDARAEIAELRELVDSLQSSLDTRD